MSDITRSAITTNKDLDLAISKASSAEEVKALMHSAALDQGIVVEDIFDKNVLLEVEQPAAAASTGASVKRTENIGGREFTFEAANEELLDQAVLNAYKVATALRGPDAPAAAATHPVDRTFEKSELDLAFRRGEISTADYLEQSGAINDYLQEKGIDADAIASTAERAYEQSWADATTEFLNGPLGSDWPGGQKNLAIIGRTLQGLGLTDVPDKVSALAAAFAEMKRTGAIFEGDAAGPTSPTATVDANATPQEILDAWKESQRTAGKNPDAAFSSLFSHR